MLGKMYDCFIACSKDLEYDNYKILDRVLEIMEETGMLPPYSTKLARESNSDLDMLSDAHLWEPENETNT